MVNRRFYSKPWLKNFLLCISSLTFILLIGEWLFPFFLTKIPLKFYGYLDRALLTLVQSSKNSVVPKDYIAILGDSYAAGLGEWLNEEIKTNSLSNPDYGAAHILYNKLKRDVVNFGSGGTGSIEGLVSLPIVQLKSINSYSAFNLEKPNQILAFFFEGNDLEDNLRDLERFYKPKYDMKKIYETKYFQEFLKNEIVENHPLIRNVTVFDNLSFSSFLGKGLLNLFNKFWTEEDYYEKNWQILKIKEKLYQLDLKKAVHTHPAHLINIASVDNKKWVFNKRNMGASLELSGEEISLGVYVFEQSLEFMRKYFEDSKISIIYIPSTLSSYQLLTLEESGLKKLKGFRSDYNLRLHTIKKRSKFICNKIEEIATKYNFGFLDAGKYIRRVTKKEILHGSVDQDHFNKKGYYVLSDGIIETFFSGDNPAAIRGCIYE